MDGFYQDDKVGCFLFNGLFVPCCRVPSCSFFAVHPRAVHWLVPALHMFTTPVHRHLHAACTALAFSWPLTIPCCDLVSFRCFERDDQTTDVWTSEATPHDLLHAGRLAGRACTRLAPPSAQACTPICIHARLPSCTHTATHMHTKWPHPSASD